MLLNLLVELCEFTVVIVLSQSIYYMSFPKGDAVRGWGFFHSKQHPHLRAAVSPRRAPGPNGVQVSPNCEGDYFDSLRGLTITLLLNIRPQLAQQLLIHTLAARQFDLAQALCDRGIKHFSQSIVLLCQLFRHLGGDDQELAILFRDDVRRALRARQRGQLAEEIVFIQIIQNNIIIVLEISRRRAAFQNEIRRVACLAAIDNDLATARFRRPNMRCTLLKVAI